MLLIIDKLKDKERMQDNYNWKQPVTDLKKYNGKVCHQEVRRGNIRVMEGK